MVRSRRQLMTANAGSASDGNSNSNNGIPSTILLLSVAAFGFFSGTLLTLHSGLGNCNGGSPLESILAFANLSGSNNKNNFNDAQLEQLVLERIKEIKKSLPTCQTKDDGSSMSNNNNNGSNIINPIQFPPTTFRYATGIARTPKLDFAEMIDTGVPLDLPNQDDSEVLILYSNPQTLPDEYFNRITESVTSTTGTSTSHIPTFQPEEALEHCDFLNIVLTNHDKKRNQCIAIMPQYESYHIQKWMRLAKHPEHGTFGGVDSQEPLIPVSRGVPPSGQNQFKVPTTQDIHDNWDVLSKYFASYEQSLNELRPLAAKVATKTGNTVTVMVCNFGQSELLVNFVCAAHSRNLDTSSILVFATDEETKELAESLGLTAYYDERNFGEMPSEAARAYGDKRFTAMMMAKVICVQMINALKYNVLFQDVDIVWYKNPISYFENDLKHFDMLFQDDGGHTVRYAPYSANSGFYYVRHNAKTEYFFSSLLLAGDLILRTDSHQQALIALMGEHVSLYGLRIKVFSRDEDDFPGGYHFHQVTGKYLRAFYAGKVDPYIFHMSWTKNKDNKLLFFQQMGDWYVHDECIHKTISEIEASKQEEPLLMEFDGTNYVSTCCSVEPIIKCHYRDKPSKIPCHDSPPIDKNRKSWWNK